MTHHDLIAAFETLAEAPDGVKRLRELVLQLAVRGKLVPQDAGDEPAWKLVERASQYKTKARSVGKTSGVADAPYVAPPGWVWTATTALGDTSPRNKVEDDAVVGFVPMASVPKEYGASLNPELRSWAEIKKGFTHIADGDIAVAKITPCFQNGKACVVSGLPFGVGAGTTELLVLRPYPETLDARYALAFFKSPDFVRGGVETFTGTAGQQRVSNDYFRNRPFPLPPLAEQHRIVARVDELMSLLDRLEAARATRDDVRRAARDAALAALRDAEDTEAVEAAWGRIAGHMDALFAEPEDVAPLRQAVLQLAVRGRLVPQDPTDEPAEVLLRKVVAKRMEIGGRPSKGGAVPPNEYPYSIPANWAWARFGDIFECRLGKMLDKAKNRGSLHPYLRNANVRWGSFDLSDVHEMRLEAHEVPDVTIKKGDLVICEGGEPGRAAVWDSEEPFVIQKALHRARPYLVHSKYYQIHLRADCASGRIAEKFTGATIQHFTGQVLDKHTVTIPPLAEQHRIVAKVDALMALCDTLEARLTAARDLHAAFAAAAVHHLDL